MAPEGTIVADVGPQSALARLMLGQHRHGSVVAVHATAGKNVGADEIVDRMQDGSAAADLIGQRRNAQIDAFAGIALGLAIERLMLPRSEEHTSELQSRVDLVCRLLLEK